MRLRATLLAGAGAAAFGFGAAAHAQGADEVDEVIVTAQKRQERLQEVPISVSAFDREALERSSAMRLTDLSSRMPNVQLSELPTFPDAGTFAIRGLSYGDVESTFEATVGVEVDGVYFARSTGFALDLFDVESIEVLRGPQGTLYGRNTIGGVVAVRTRRPTGEPGYRAQLTVGDRGRVEVRTAAEGPLVDEVLAVKLALRMKRYDGYLRNLVDGRRLGGIDSFSQRLTLAYTPSDTFDATLIVDHTKDRDDGVPNKNGTPRLGSLPPSAPNFLIAAFGFPARLTDGPWEVRYTGPIYYNFETSGATLEANWDLGFGTLTSVTGYRIYQDLDINEYSGAGNIDLLKAERSQAHNQESQELRLASNGDPRLKYVIGAYYLRQKYAINNHYMGVIFPPGGSVQHAEQVNHAMALFGQVDYELTEALTLTLGGRYSYEDKDFLNRPLFSPVTFTYEDSWDDFSPKLGLKYTISPDLMVYATYAKGFRSGGFNGRAGSRTSAGPYDAETVQSFEVGFKSELLDNRLRLNGDVFHTKYKDIQLGVQGLVPGTTNIQETVVRNAGAATIYGAEAEARAVLVGGLTVDAAVGYLHAEFDRFVANLYGNCGVGTASPQGLFCGVHDYAFLPFPRAPRWTGGVTLNWERRTELGTLNANVSATFTSKYETSLHILNAFTDYSERGFAQQLNATVSMTSRDERYRVAAWVKNLTNEANLYSRSAIGTLSSIEQYDPPRAWGIDLSVQF